LKKLSYSIPYIMQHNMANEVNLNRIQHHHPFEIKAVPDAKIRKDFRARFRDFYGKDTTQAVVSIIILLNGLLYIVQTGDWTDNCCVHNSNAQELVEYFDFGFLLLYTIELSLNFYSHFFWQFWTKTKWNSFDLIVILVSWLPAQNLAAIRLFRVLRLIRLSGRLGSFAFIIKTLRKSMAGITSLLTLLLGVMIIYAILGVGIFGEVSDKFKDFFTAMWTLFITLNGESWPGFAEPLIDQFWYTTLFFGSFIITVSIIVLNMIIAVFIEKTAEVLREQRDETCKKIANSAPGNKSDQLPNPGSATIYDGTVDFNWKEVQHCVFVLLGWESQNLISRLEGRRGVNQLLTSNGLRSLSKPIREGNVMLVQSLLRNPVR